MSKVIITLQIHYFVVLSNNVIRNCRISFLPVILCSYVLKYVVFSTVYYCIIML